VLVESGVVEAETASCWVLLEVVLFESVTVSVTLYELAWEYVWMALAPMPDDPSQKIPAVTVR